MIVLGNFKCVDMEGGESLSRAMECSEGAGVDAIETVVVVVVATGAGDKLAIDGEWVLPFVCV